MLQHYQFFSELLDTVGLAACLYDEDARAVLWNQNFLAFFPEHAEGIFAGEPYRENLLRFYRGRLAEKDLPDIDRYVADGIARHLGQSRPYSFEHHGVWLRVSCLHMPGVGRLRI